MSARTHEQLVIMFADGNDAADRDGDGEIDEGVTSIFYTDLDGDGFGGAGSNTVNLAIGGTAASRSAATEEWAFTGIQPTDPAAGYANAITGDFYYNSTTGQFKNVSSGVGSWASGGNLNGGRYGIMGAGTLTAGLAMGGTFQPSDTTKNTAETYNGISWTNAPTLPGNIRDGGSWGVQTSAVQVGGSTSPGATPFGSTAYEFDGSSFSNGGSLNTARRYNAGAGAASTAGITFGGGNPGPYVAITESYDGSTFTEVADLNTARNYLGAAGTQTAAIAAGGNTGSDVANVELWDGSSWTETTDINTARYNGGAAGTYTSALIFGGMNQAGTNDAETEFWNGSSWTEVGDLTTAMGSVCGFGTTSAGNAAGTGALMALLNKESRSKIQLLVERITKVETAMAPNFQAHFVAATGIPNSFEQYPNLNNIVTLPTVNFNQRKNRRNRKSN